jgi:hypothetical protein
LGEEFPLVKLDRRPFLKGRAAMAVWQRSQPDSVVSDGYLTRSEINFLSTRTVGAGAKTVCYVRLIDFRHGRCALHVQMRLHDQRVAALEAALFADDTEDSPMLVLSVEGAYSVIAGEQLSGFTMVDSNCSPEDFAPAAENYSRKIDRIWQSVGGCSVAGLEALAIWALRNREQPGLFAMGLAPACTALVYGEKALARTLLERELRSWQSTDRLEVNVDPRLRKAGERLLEMLNVPTAD